MPKPEAAYSYNLTGDAGDVMDVLTTKRFRGQLTDLPFRGIRFIIKPQDTEASYRLNRQKPPKQDR